MTRPLQPRAAILHGPPGSVAAAEVAVRGPRSAAAAKIAVLEGSMVLGGCLFVFLTPPTPAPKKFVAGTTLPGLLSVAREVARSCCTVQSLLSWPTCPATVACCAGRCLGDLCSHPPPVVVAGSYPPPGGLHVVMSTAPTRWQPLCCLAEGVDVDPDKEAGPSRLPGDGEVSRGPVDVVPAPFPQTVYGPSGGAACLPRLAGHPCRSCRRQRSPRSSRSRHCRPG